MSRIPIFSRRAGCPRVTCPPVHVAQVSTCDELLLTELVFDGALSTLQALLLLHCTRGALSTLQALLLLLYLSSLWPRLLLLCSRLLLCSQPAQLAALLSCMVSEGGAAAGKKEQGAAAAAVRLPAMQEPVNRLRELARKARRLHHSILSLLYEPR